MDEEATPGLSASPLTKSGGNKRSESSTSGWKSVPHYMRASTGSCHEFCKHGKHEDRASGVKDSRPWRKPIVGNGRDDSGIVDSVKRSVVVKSRPSADHKVLSPPSKVTMGSEISKISIPIENMDVLTPQAFSQTDTEAGEPCTSDGPKTALLSAETVKREIGASDNVMEAAEGDPSDAKDCKISKKPNALASQDKPSVRRSPSPISSGSIFGRSVDGRKRLEGMKTFDGRKAFEGRKVIDGQKNAQGSNTKESRKDFDESKRVLPETTQICDVSADTAENTSECSMSVDPTKSIEGRQSSPETEGSEEQKSSKLQGRKRDDSLGIAKVNGKSELSNKKTPSPLHPSSAPSRNNIAAKLPSPLHPSSAPSRNTIAAKQASPMHPSSASSRNQIAAKLPSPLHPSSARSRNPIATKPPSPMHPFSGTRCKTTDGNQVAIKLTSKMEMKKVDTSTVVSPSPRPSSNGEEINNMKKIRVIRVVSTVRRKRKITNVAANDADGEGSKEHTAEAIKITPAKNSMTSNEEESSGYQLPLAPPVSKYTLRSRISSVPSRPTNSPSEPAQKIATKDTSTSRRKAVEVQSENHRLIALRPKKVPSIGGTAHTSRRSVKKRITSSGKTLEKSNSGRFLSRRPSARQKKNVQVLFNKVIEETASRLVRTSKSKVLALVGAFETVISIQRKSSAATTPKSKKTISKTSDQLCHIAGYPLLQQH